MQIELFNKVAGLEIQEFIRAQEHADEKKLVLTSREMFGVPTPIIADQIAGRRKAKLKLPLFYERPGIIYPKSLNLEQSSSQLTAIWKADKIAASCPPAKTVADLSGGFGVDSFFLSKRFVHVNYVEPDQDLGFIAQSNHTALQAENIIHYPITAQEFLETMDTSVDLFYIDPSRRIGSSKVHRLSDCEPNILLLMPDLFKKAAHVFIKASPMLDISQAVDELKSVSGVFVVSVDQECRELLFHCQPGWQEEPYIETVHIKRDREENFRFRDSEEKSASVTYATPMRFLYEPNPSIMKAGAFKLPAVRYSLLKLHKNTHLYTSRDLVENFPGRVFEIRMTLKSDPRAAEKVIPERKANILVRNYPLQAPDLAKKLRFREGGEKFIIAFKSIAGAEIVVADRIR